MTDDTRLERTKELYKLANEACDIACTKHDVGGAVNWADLRCVEATFCINQDGEESYRVLIEEADPSAPALHKFVFNYLNKNGFENVEVDTAW